MGLFGFGKKDKPPKQPKPNKRLDVYDGRLKPITDLGAILALQDYVVLDVETTGLDSAAERIVEVAAKRYRGGQLDGTYDTLVDPGKKLPPLITNLTGITNDQIAGGKPYHAMVDELEAFLGDLPVVAHNSQFDTEFLSAAFVFCGRYGAFRHVDTVPLARKAFPGLENYKLATLIRELRLSDKPQTHRAMDDVECTDKLFDLCRGMLRAKGALTGPLRKAKKALSSLDEAHTPVDVFLAYEMAESAVAKAWEKDPEAAAIMFPEDYLQNNFSEKIYSVIDWGYEAERKAIQKLKTRRAILSHIEKYRTVFDTNGDKLTDGQKRRVEERAQELLRICDMIAPVK